MENSNRIRSFFFSSRRRHTRLQGDWSSDVCSSDLADVEVARDGAVQTITLNRPEKMNAFTRNVHAELREALKQARDPEVRVVVVTGAGRAFCAGQDLTEFGETGDIGAALRATYHPNILAVRALE